MIADLTARLTRKSRSNFYYAFLTLPRPRREALYAVYAFCRTVDDIADLGGAGGADPAAQRRELRRWREEVARCYDARGIPEHPIAVRLQAAVRAYTIPRARQYAVDLGTALQLTNIIRDVGADARAGRVYVPQADLRAFGVTVDDLKAGRYTEQFVRLMTHQAARARRFYRFAWESFPTVDARTLVAAEIMARIYLALLGEIEARRFRVFDERITVPVARNLAIPLRCWIAARLGRPAQMVAA